MSLKGRNSGRLVKMITLHVGAPKCGSSAIQTALTANPCLVDKDGNKVTYGVIKKGGEFYAGRDVVANPVRGYLSSTAPKGILRLDASKMASLAQRIAACRHQHLVISQESWFIAYEDAGEVIRRLGLEADVVIYVRPQPLVLNSGWWQWGAWDQKPLDKWIAKRLPRTIWTHYVEKWQSLPGVREVIVRPVPRDVVSDFLSVLNCPPLARGETRANAGLPKEILRLYQRNPQLRPHKDASEIDFALSRALNLPGSAPWVLRPEMVQGILDKSRQSNLALLGLMDEECREAVKNDPLWWDAEAYADRKPEPWEPTPPDPAELERLCAEMAAAIHRLAARGPSD